MKMLPSPRVLPESYPRPFSQSDSVPHFQEAESGDGQRVTSGGKTWQDRQAKADITNDVIVITWHRVIPLWHSWEKKPNTYT